MSGIHISPNIIEWNCEKIFDKQSNILNLKLVDDFLYKKIDNLEAYYKLWKGSENYFTDESLNVKWEEQQQKQFYAFTEKSTSEIEQLRDGLFKILCDKVAKNPKLSVGNSEPEIEKLKNTISKTTIVFSVLEKALKTSPSSWCSANFLNNYSLKLDS